MSANRVTNDQIYRRWVLISDGLAESTLFHFVDGLTRIFSESTYNAGTLANLQAGEEVDQIPRGIPFDGGSKIIFSSGYAIYAFAETGDASFLYMGIAS